MNKLLSITFITLLIILWGCSESTVPTDSSLSDEDQIRSEILTIESSADEDYFYADIDEESENNFIEPFAASFQKPIIPLRFGRIRLYPLVRDIHIVFTSDSTAEAYFYKAIRGNFVSLVADPSGQDVANIHRVIRPMGHEFHRIVHFVKKDNHWRLDDFSMVLGNSVGIVNTADVQSVNTTLQITKLVLDANERTVEITDPL